MEIQKEWTGREAIAHLAETYQQLYLRPGEEGRAAYRDIVRKGASAESKDLSHFRGHRENRLAYEETPAGEVLVLTLHERADFELFLQIMANRCEPCAIPPTQGASILDGVVNWPKIRQHRAEFLLSEQQAGNPLPDWPAEFRRFTADKRNYTDALLVLSVGPYSGIAAERVNMTEQEWLARSMTIRRVHECTHFLCRRLWPEKIDPIWDELVADAAGLYDAFGRFDLPMAELFLGVGPEGYTGGRLQNYAEGADLDALAGRVHQTLTAFDALLAENGGASGFDAATALEAQKERLWDGA